MMEITAAPFDRIIYIGSGHSGKTKCPDCDMPRYVQERIEFETRHDGILILTAKKCLSQTKRAHPSFKKKRTCF